MKRNAFLLKKKVKILWQLLATWLIKWKRKIGQNENIDGYSSSNKFNELKVYG